MPRALPARLPQPPPPPSPARPRPRPLRHRRGRSPGSARAAPPPPRRAPRPQRGVPEHRPRPQLPAHGLTERRGRGAAPARRRLASVAVPCGPGGRRSAERSRAGRAPSALPCWLQGRGPRRPANQRRAGPGDHQSEPARAARAAARGGGGAAVNGQRGWVRRGADQGRG